MNLIPGLPRRNRRHVRSAPPTTPECCRAPATGPASPVGHRHERRAPYRAVARCAIAPALSPRATDASAASSAAPRSSRRAMRRRRMISLPTESAANSCARCSGVGLVRHADEPAVDMALPIAFAGSRPVASRRRSRKVSASSRRVRNAGDSGGTRRNDRAAKPAAGDDRQRGVVELPRCRSSSGWSGARSGTKISCHRGRTGRSARASALAPQSADRHKENADGQGKAAKRPSQSRQHRKGDDRRERQADDGCQP